MRILGKLGSKRNDPRLFGNKGNTKEEHKPVGGRKQQPSEMSQILNAIKGLNPPQARIDRNPIENKAPYQSNFNRQNRLQNLPYNTTWRDAQPSVPLAKNINNKVTPDPLSRNAINMVDDPKFTAEPTWCVAF